MFAIPKSKDSKAFPKLPKELYRSLTWDRGTEMTDHLRFTVATKIDVYFCDPQSPWQRGSNENTNRLLRQYFPRGLDMATYGTHSLSRIKAGEIYQKTGNLRAVQLLLEHTKIDSTVHYL